MIRLLKWAIALGLIWSVYWYGAGFALRQSVSGWFAAQAARGWQADFAEIGTSGYPWRHFTQLTGPALADPATGTAWQADWLLLDSPAIWPGRQNLHFADTPQRLSYFDQTVVVTASDMVARMHLHPGLALALDRMALSAGDWQITGEDGPVAMAGSLILSMTQTEQPETYQFDIDASRFTPGDGMRRLVQSNPSMPASFETLSLDMAVTFDRIWDRKALEERRPQPVAVDLALAELQWGELRLMAAGDLTVDAGGIPTGAITIKAENWREMLAMAQAAGAIPAEAVDPAERVLKMLAGLGGNPNALDVQINLRDGFVALGPIPLGPAPRLVLR